MKINNLVKKEQATAQPASIRDAFNKWVSTSHSQTGRQHVYVTCIDEISNYLKKKNSSYSIWEITDSETFKTVYRKIMESRLLRITETKLYLAFIDAGRLYLKFIENKTWEQHSSTMNKLQSASSCNLRGSLDNEKALKILTLRFANGYRIASSIDYQRFKNYYKDEHGAEFEHSAKWLNRLLSRESLVYDDRAYIFSDETKNSIRLYIDQLRTPCIYLDTFYATFLDELYAFGIFSCEMFRAFVELYYKDISIKWNYLTKEDVAPSDLIRGAFTERDMWTVEQLEKKFPFFKAETIRNTLNNQEYVRVDTGTYIHISNMDLPLNEGKKLSSIIKEKLATQDYVTTMELDYTVFETLNPHCPILPIRDAVFRKFLSGSFEKKGYIIAKKGQKLSVLDILEQYCRKAETVSLKEINDLEATFDPLGRTHSRGVLAGCNIMIRVNADLFVSESKVDFDATRIDRVISMYCQKDFMPIREISDFSLFPFVGYPWNLFLLESYLRRFSHVFEYAVRSANSSSIGAIVRKSLNYDGYEDILIMELAGSTVLLDNRKAVVNHLFNKGYIGWRNLGANERGIIDNAKRLREDGTI